MRGWLTKGFGLCIIVLICVMTGIAPLLFPSVALVSAQPKLQYTVGDFTYVNKPVLPVKIDESQIPVGSNWTYIYTLQADSAYRVYCYGDWIDSSEVNKTDYDIFVYDAYGNLESYHTEAAGLPEHLGTTVDHPFFIPKQNGTYSFCVKNDARESKGAEAATFMLIEHVEPDRWYNRHMRGKINDQPVEETSWAYEFNTTSSHIEVWVEVPDTLDMYEARLYIMANPSAGVGSVLNGVPLAWEEGLYGSTSGIYGGYNLDSEGFRYNEMSASCEYPGEDMLINFTAPVEGNLLYHLAFIAENGEGNINFMVKTDFDILLLSILDPVEKVNPNDETIISAHVEEQFNLETVTLHYTKDNWATSAAVEMIASQNQIYAGTIPGQQAGTTIKYRVVARDAIGNTGEACGSFEVKNSANVTLEVSNSEGYLGKNILVTGSVPVGETTVTVKYSCGDQVVSNVVSTDSSGVFNDAFFLDQTGTWTAVASWDGNNNYFGASSEYKTFTVHETPPPITYVSKPVLPVKIDESQIPVGSNWTYIYTLAAGSAYRVYCYGDWIDSSSEANKTDYDIFVYDPSGELESYHTEAAGLPEHLGTTVDHPFFIPEQSGNYSFVVKNDAGESKGAEAATFMLIEHVEPDRWYNRHMKGKVNNVAVEETSWAYEFNTTSSHIEVLVEVPDTLDMYEARLYIMANPSANVGSVLNGVPLAWEEGLYGSTSGIYGGYNLNSEGFRVSNAIASCEYLGCEMLINFTAPVEGNLLYHLAFIAENGEGNINFMVKTDFDAPELSLLDPVEKVNPSNETIISAHVEEQFNLETVMLNYTKDNWTTSTALEMIASQNKTYTGTIPAQAAGTVVNYTVLARDTSGNSAEVLGSYEVKNSANITLDLSSSAIYYGENITVKGSIPLGGTNVTLTYTIVNSSALNDSAIDYAIANDTILNFTLNDAVVSRLVSTDSSGVFSDAYSLNQSGRWIVWASWNGCETYFGAHSGYRNFTVQKVPMSITCNVTSKSVTIGDNITVTGSVYPIVENLTVNVIFTSANTTIKQTAYTNSNGTFYFSWKPDSMELWQVHAILAENVSRSEAYSSPMMFTVTDTWLNQYLLYIIGGVGGVAGVSVVAFIIRRRRYE